jgi:Ca2+-binding RTX toxin-like protein
MFMADVNVAAFMDGLGGDDVLFASNLDDIIFGGDGADKLFSGEGKDQVFGGEGDDVIFGEGGDDVATGGAGSDIVMGGVGNDRFIATIGDGNDLYFGEEGADTLDMSAITANTTVDLGSTRFGSGSAVSDQTGYDVFSGIENVITGSGNDKIYANDEVNMINAGSGNDTILFRSAASANGDTIFGFEAGDLICLQQMDANLGVGGLQGFTLVAGQSFSDAGQLLIRHEMRDGGEVSIIEGNIGGDLQADFQIEVFGVLVQESNLLL